MGSEVGRSAATMIPVDGYRERQRRAERSTRGMLTIEIPRQDKIQYWYHDGPESSKVTKTLLLLL